jgi:hypothetical protein
MYAQKRTLWPLNLMVQPNPQITERLQPAAGERQS